MVGEKTLLDIILVDLHKIKDDDEINIIHLEHGDPDFKGNSMHSVQIQYFRGKRPCSEPGDYADVS